MGGVAPFRVLREDLVLRWSMLASGAWLAAFAVATALAQQGAVDPRIVGDVVYVVPVAAAAVLAIVASWHAQPHQRPFWRLLAVSNLGWLCGELIWGVLELVGREVPFPSIADAFYLGSYLLVLPAAVVGFRPALTSQLWRALIDASIALAGIGYLGYVLLIAPQLKNGATLATATGIAYPLVGVLIIVILGSLAFAAHQQVPLSTTLVLLGFLVSALTDAAYTYLAVLNEFLPGSWLNLGWQVEACLLCVAALAAVRQREERPSVELPRRDPGITVVLVGVLGATALVGADLVDGSLGFASGVLIAFTFGAAVVRLHITSVEKSKIAELLRTQAMELERSLEERLRTERLLEDSLSRLQASLESTTDGILVVDREGRITAHNRRFAEMWGIPDEVLAEGDDERALAHVLDKLSDPDAFVARVVELYDQPYAESEDILEFRDGRIFERYSKPQVLAGVPCGRVWSFRDVTARRDLEETLRHAQKMEAVGRLAGGVAHDFNNLLMAITGYTQLIAQSPTGEAVAYELDAIQSASDRATLLTKQLLAFGRKQVLRPVLLDLNDVVRGLDALLRPLLGEDVSVVTRLDEAIPPVLVDRGQMEQIIMNLAVNARDAMPAGGTVSIETRSVATGGRRAVALVVADTGTGMDAETQARIFEPFFTTKPIGYGTGLGLSTVLGIVEQSGGTISVDSRPGDGSRFTVLLEAAAPSMGAAA